MSKFSINFYIVGEVNQFAYRALTQVPMIGQRCVFNEKRYEIIMVEWCLDEGATNSSREARINIELKPV